MKKRMIATAVLAASLMGVAEARIMTFFVNGSGMATESDRDTAVSEATDNATQQANAICTGVVTNVEKTGTMCVGGTDDIPYVCTVFVKAACQVNVK
jgi:hypothetical protein